ncbi:hypothetical protein MMC13_007103 [Lambiella insularis]|nr:hypothetical protein [Lambiella insularis]
MTSSELQEQIVRIKQSLASAASCTTATTDALSSILSPRTSGKSEDARHTRTVRVQEAKVPATRGRRALTVGTKKKLEVVVLEVQEPQEKPLSPLEKAKLAAEVVNLTLKSMTEVIKTRISQKPFRKPTQPSLTTSSTEGRDCRAAKSPRPLQSRSSNQLGKSFTGKLGTRCSLGVTSASEDGTLALAQSAQAAFTALRALEIQGPIKCQLPAHQIDSGMSAFVGKLVSLGLEELAVKELKILLRRLSPPIMSAKSKGLSVEKVAPSFQTKPAITDLLRIDDIPANHQALTLIISSQLQILKILALKKRGRLVEAALGHLQLSCPSSPANLLGKLIASEIPEVSEKGSRQMEVLAQILLTMCPGPLPSEDERAADPDIYAPPMIILNYQMLAIELRSKWWKAAKHQVDMEKEMLEPFSRYLDAFVRRSNTTHSKKFEVAEDTINRFSEMAGMELSATLEKGFSPRMAMANVLRTLSCLAQKCQRFDDAIQYSTLLLSNLQENDASKARICATLCELAKMELHAPTLSVKGMSDQALDTMRDVVQSLNGNLSGDSSDLDELLVCTASLRKVAVGFLHKLPQDSDRCNGVRDNLDLGKTFCLEIVLLCSRFLTRYLGEEPDPEASSVVTQRFEKRQSLSLHILRPTVEAVASLTKLRLCDNPETWLNVDSALQDCARLLLKFQDSDHNLSNSSSLFTTLSNAYWCQYLRQKQLASDLRYIRTFLHRSIDVLNDRPPLEKQAGFLPIKLERLAELYQSCNEDHKALATYDEALRIQFDAGSLRVATERAATKPLSQAFDADSGTLVLTRLISCYSILSLRLGSMNENRPYFDDRNLPLDQRGVLLEYQLNTLASFLHSHKSPADQAVTAATVRGLTHALLEIYTPEEFPIRRIRCLGQVFRIHAAQNTVFTQKYMAEVFAVARCNESQSLGYDIGLSRYSKHLLASQEAFSTMSGGTPSNQVLTSSLNTWVELVDRCDTRMMLEGFVNDVYEWSIQLATIAEYFRMQGFEKQLSSTLRLMCKLHDLSGDERDPIQMTGNIAFGLQAIKFGCSGRAAELFQRTRRHIDNGSLRQDVVIQWHIAYAKFLLEIGSLDKCEKHIQMAREQLVTLAASSDFDPRNFEHKYKKSSFYAEVAQLLSMLCLVRGNPAIALFHARMSVKLSYKLWLLLERRHKASLAKRTGLLLGGMDADSLPDLPLPETQAIPVLSMTHTSLGSSAFWPLVPELFSRLLHLSKTYAQEGIFSEAQCYAERAVKIADAIQAGPRLAQANAIVCDYEIRRGGVGSDLALLSLSVGTISDECTPSEGVMAQLALANAFAAANDVESEVKALQVAKKIATEKSHHFVFEDLGHLSDEAEDIASQMLKLSLRADKSSLHNKRHLPIEVHRTKRCQKVAATENSVDEASARYIPLAQLQSHVLREMGCSATRVGAFDKSNIYFGNAETLPTTNQGKTYLVAAMAQLSLGYGLHHVLNDPILSVLADSAISCPSVTTGGRRPCNADMDRGKSNSEATQARKTRTIRKERNPKRAVASESRQFHEFLYKALNAIWTIHESAQYRCSISRLHLVSSTLFKTIIMLSAACPSLPQANVGPTFGIYAMELGRSVAALRESSAVHAEKLLTARKDNGEDDVDPPEYVASIACSTIDVTTFQADYIDIIPRSWTVITISLSEDRRELRLARLRAKQSPFILAMPFDRQSSREGGDRVFDFAEGRSELLEVIDLANFSTHDARDMSKKGAKSEWWEARTALDARLKGLLDNVESFWLGGFRGIFSPQSSRQDLLARLQQSFSNILTKHLPSRQQHGSVDLSSRVTIDAQVLELFVGLGKPTGVDDFDELLMDLLYFVVDILQFNGERNAYDEIDFDSIVVETIDALTQYHEALDGDEGNPGQHIILILDKKLHCFPWESLPCISGMAVSRLPSLVHLQSRILKQRSQSFDGHNFSSEGFCIDSSIGAYILNPAGDLSSTQDLFQKPLAALTNWSATVGRAPSEAEISAFLSNRSLYLYFGHGSGSQYIRSRTIKKLDSCAVSLLMGCSSSTFTEEGEFESDGVPMDYLHAGAQAVVGTLWDVTDKDIDRFSMRTLERWGLLGEALEVENRSPTKKVAKGKGRARPKDTLGIARSQMSKVSLDQAVSDGRGACFLKYLNGAAPVMYGTPVYLASEGQ